MLTPHPPPPHYTNGPAVVWVLDTTPTATRIVLQELPDAIWLQPAEPEPAISLAPLARLKPRGGRAARDPVTPFRAHHHRPREARRECQPIPFRY